MRFPIGRVGPALAVSLVLVAATEPDNDGISVPDPVQLEAGEWDAAIRFPSPQPGSADQTARGHQSNEVRSDGKWMLNRFSVEGTSYQGTGIWGWDRITRRYRGIWTDNNDRQIRADDGQWNPATRVMTWHSHILQSDGSYLPLLMTETFEADRRLFRSVALTRKGEVPLIQIEFSRSKSDTESH